MSRRLYEEIEYNNFEKFYNDVLVSDAINLDDYIFRGVSDYEYKLIPRILREEEIEKINILSDYRQSDDSIFAKFVRELDIVKKFYDYANFQGLVVPEVQDFIHLEENRTYFLVKELREWIPGRYYEVFAIAQHYGIPTRLLDWTFDIKIAILFCINGVLRKIDKNKIIPDGKFALWMLNYKIMSMLKSNIDRFLKIIVPKYYWNDNIRMQKGVFTLEKINLSSKDYRDKERVYCLEDKIKSCNITSDLIRNPLLYKFVFDNSCIKKAYRIIKRLGCNFSQILPGTHNIARCIELESKLKEEKEYYYIL